MNIIETLKNKKGLCIVLTVFVLSGCSQKDNFAPVRSYGISLGEQVRFYRVQPGDTLFSVGFRSGHSFHQLARWNNLSPPYKLLVGQRLKLFKSVGSTKKLFSKENKGRKENKSRVVQRKSKVVTGFKGRMSWQWPLEGRLLQSFKKTGLKGIDIAGKSGQEVVAVSDGRVVYSGDGLKGYGNLIIIKHNEHFLSAYANNSRLFVQEGQTIRQGQKIAEVGRNNDNRLGLHFEIRKDGKSVNPAHYLPKK
jgi:lipoprotein NlpD